MIHPILTLLAGSFPANSGATAPGTAAAEVVAVRAGTILTVENGTIEGGGTILIEDGRITAIGKDSEVPGGARVIDYGPDAVIVPGLVSANSSFDVLRPSDRTADPAVMAIDGFDPFGSYVFALQEGVTSAYLPPARGRLISGQGALVKLAGRNESGGAGRALVESAAIHGSVGPDARRTPGYWEPPLPATVDVGMGVEDPQLPRTLMGAIVALGELVELARGDTEDRRYGSHTGALLRELIDAKRPWRMGATTAPEIRALLAFFQEKGLPLVIDGASGAAPLAGEIANTGFPVIVRAPILANGAGGTSARIATPRSRSSTSPRASSARTSASRSRRPTTPPRATCGSPRGSPPGAVSTGPRRCARSRCRRPRSWAHPTASGASFPARTPTSPCSTAIRSSPARPRSRLGSTARRSSSAPTRRPRPSSCRSTSSTSATARSCGPARS